MPDTKTDLVVVGAGPAGSAAAAWAARVGREVLLVDRAVFPRDKTCGDGLTPRAIHELTKLGLGDWLRGRTVNQGLRAHGFGQRLHLPWPGGTLPDWGSAAPRTELDDRIRQVAIDAGARAIDGAQAVDVIRHGPKVTAVVFRSGEENFQIACERLIIADGVRSPLGKMLGRRWHRDTVYGVAGRSYMDSGMSDDPWISSHLELRDENDENLPGYGWVFPLGNGQVNIGLGTLATAKHPANLAVKPLIDVYARLRREDFQLSGEPKEKTSALLPMGGAVSQVAGENWALIGDAAACVNPLNGEGIDYALETGRLAVDLMGDAEDLSEAWPALLSEVYGEGFSIARRLASLITVPGLLPVAGPVGMRSDFLMTLALRWMGNLITDQDRDAAARIWRWAGRRSIQLEQRPPFH